MNKKSNAERLAVIETEIGYIKNNLKDITENHIQHIYGKLDKLEKFCSTLKNVLDDVKKNNKGKMTGRDKAVIYASLITAIGSIVVAIIAIFA